MSHLRVTALFALVLLFAASCKLSDDDRCGKGFYFEEGHCYEEEDTSDTGSGPVDTGEDTDTDTEGQIIISGVAVISGGATIKDDDGLGTLCVALTDKCADMTAMTDPPKPVGSENAMAEVLDADFSDLSNQVPFRIKVPEAEVPDGPCVVTGFLKLDGAACDAVSEGATEAGPADGDPVSFNMAPADKACPAITIAGEGKHTGLVVKLTFNMISM